jgi:hypothetical protein
MIATPRKVDHVFPIRKEVAMARKTVCPITRRQFRDKAQSVTVTLAGVPMVIPTKEFSTGSLGWYLNAKTMPEVDGKQVPVQLGLSLTIVGSKELPEEPEPAVPAVAAAAAAAPAPEPEPAQVA